MKTQKMFLYYAAAALLGTMALSSCNDDDDDTPPVTPPGSTVVELTGDLSTQTLTAGTDYLLKGQVFVRNGQVLTMEPGTVIKCDKATRATLIIDRGGRLEANGTVTNPIVLTSSQPVGVRDRGDWGGLVILGNASTNQVDPAIEGITPPVRFGGNPGNQISSNVAIEDENSGTYRYLRVEFGGIELSPNNETNSITMGGVGRGTTMEYCMTSFGGDDNFEWFGGTVNGKYFISVATWDDDFDCDFGWSGNVQYGLAIRYPGYADQSGSNGFECDNGPTDDDVVPYTTGTFSNITVIGPIKEGDRVSNGNFQHNMDLRRRTAVRIANSVFAGFPRGLRFNAASVQNNFVNGGTTGGYLFNNIMAGTNNSNTYLSGGGADAAVVQQVWEDDNTTIPGPATNAIHQSLGLNPDWWYGSRLASDYPSNPSFTVTSGTIASGADFSAPFFSEANRAGFFDTNVQFIGGFGANDWTQGWADFNPVDNAY